MSLLRKLILRFQPLPNQTAYSLLNYLVSSYALFSLLWVRIMKKFLNLASFSLDSLCTT